MNQQNEVARSVRQLIERIDYALENEHLTYKTSIFSYLFSDAYGNADLG